MGVAGTGAVFRSPQAPTHPEGGWEWEAAPLVPGTPSSSPLLWLGAAVGRELAWLSLAPHQCLWKPWLWNVLHKLTLKSLFWEESSSTNTEIQREVLWGQPVTTKTSNIWDKIQNLQDTELPKALYVRQEITEPCAKMHDHTHMVLAP